MKVLGFFAALFVALAVWLATCAVLAGLFAFVPERYRAFGLIAVVAVLVGGSIGGWRAAKETAAAIERAARRAARRSAAKSAAFLRVRRAESQQVADQRLLANNLQLRLTGVRDLAANLPALVHRAETSLDVAEGEFRAHAIVPFWEAIERAAESLAQFTATLDSLAEKCRTYRRDGARLEAGAPPFTLGVAALPDVARTAQRLEQVVRRSHSDVEFSTIYEMRKSGVIPAAGFLTLSQAIHGAEATLTIALKNLAMSVAEKSESSASLTVPIFKLPQRA